MSMMDLEPGRCRRTDGKKWRCRRQVVPDYKYCELHVHRGCQGSRKLVEASEKISQSGTAITGKIKERSKPISAKIANAMDAELSTSIPATQELITKTKSLNTSNYVPFTGTAKTSSTPFASGNSRINDIGAANCGTHVGLTMNSDKQVDIKTEISNASATTVDPIGTTYANPTLDKSESNNVESKNAGYNEIDKKTVVHGSSRGYNGRDIPFGLSPTSVLQDGKVLASNIIENDLWRCKRTDGKKWRCRFDAIPDQKYCERHMHRGAKKSRVVSEPVTIAVVTPPLARPRQANDSMNLNTDCSISTAGDPRQAADEKNSYVSINSSSDATTVSDDYVIVDQLLDLSP